MNDVIRIISFFPNDVPFRFCGVLSCVFDSRVVFVCELFQEPVFRLNVN